MKALRNLARSGDRALSSNRLHSQEKDHIHIYVVQGLSRFFSPPAPHGEQLFSVSSWNIEGKDVHTLQLFILAVSVISMCIKNASSGGVLS